MKPFTDKFIAALKPRSKKYYVREGRGFAIQVMPSGFKTFMFIYTFRGKRKYLSLGNYPAPISLAVARQNYLEAAQLVGTGVDPQAPPPPELPTPEDPTIKEMAKLWLEGY